MMCPSVGVVEPSGTAAAATLGTNTRLFRRASGLEVTLLFVLPDLRALFLDDLPLTGRVFPICFCMISLPAMATSHVATSMCRGGA